MFNSMLFVRHPCICFNTSLFVCLYILFCLGIALFVLLQLLSSQYLLDVVKLFLSKYSCVRLIIMESFILKIEEACVVCKFMSNFDDILHLLLTDMICLSTGCTSNTSRGIYIPSSYVKYVCLDKYICYFSTVCNLLQLWRYLIGRDSPTWHWTKHSVPL